MPWITDNALAAAAASREGMAAASALASNWTDVASAANAMAYGRIRAVMLGRGFTAAVLDTWDARESWNLEIGLLYVEWKVAGGSNFERRPQLLQEIKDLLEMLKEETVTVDGVAVYPTGSAGRVGFGSYDTSSDVFSITPDADNETVL